MACLGLCGKSQGVLGRDKRSPRTKGLMLLS